MLLGPVGQKGRFQGNSSCTLRKQNLSCPACLLEFRPLQRNICLDQFPCSLPIRPSTHSEDTSLVPVYLRITPPISDVPSCCLVINPSTHTYPSASSNLWSGKVSLDQPRCERNYCTEFVFPQCSSKLAARLLFGARWKTVPKGENALSRCLNNCRPRALDFSPLTSILLV